MPAISLLHDLISRYWRYIEILPNPIVKHVDRVAGCKTGQVSNRDSKIFEATQNPRVEPNT